MLENYKEVVEALEDTNESVISHRAEQRAAGAHLGSRDPAAADADRQHLGHERARAGRAAIGAFWMIIGVMLCVLVGMVLFFRRRGWL